MRLRLKVPLFGGLGGSNPLKYTDPSGYEYYQPGSWDDYYSRQTPGLNPYGNYSGGNYYSSPTPGSNYSGGNDGLVDGFVEYNAKMDYIQRYGADIYAAAIKSGAIKAQSYVDFMLHTLLKADFSGGFLKVPNYVQVYGLIGGIVNKDGKLYGKSLIGGAMAAHISDTYIKVPGQSAGQGSGEGSGESNIGVKVIDAVDKTGTLLDANLYGAQRLSGMAKEAIYSSKALTVMGRVTGVYMVYDNLNKFRENPQANWWNGVSAVGGSVALGLGFASGYEEAVIVINLSLMAGDVMVNKMNNK